MHPVTHLVRHTSFFTQKERIQEGLLIPMPPFYVYRRIARRDTQFLVAPHQSWATDAILSPILSVRDTHICFSAGENTRTFPINHHLKEALGISVEPVPLLVPTTPEKSLDFAEFVVGILHRTTKVAIDEFISRNHDVVSTMSVSRRVKMYDIFPEEYISVPRHLTESLRNMDDPELLEEDINELCDKYRKK